MGHSVLINCVFLYTTMQYKTTSKSTTWSSSILNSCDVFQCRQLKRLCSRWQSPPKKLSTQVQVGFVILSLEMLFLKSQVTELLEEEDVYMPHVVNYIFYSYLCMHFKFP